MDKKEKWIANMKSRNNIIWIDSPKDSDKSSVQVAMELWDMVDMDFNVTISEMCSILLCDRNWITKYVAENVKHIFIGNPMRIFMKKIDGAKEMLKDYYYFSRNDFYRWLKENTVMERQTIVVDMVDYAYDEDRLSSLVRNYEVDKLGAGSMLEMASIISTFHSNVYKQVDNEGKELYSLRQREDKRKGCEFVEVDGDLPTEFTSSKELKVFYNNNERAYRSLFSCGAIKYTICDSLVRFDKDYSNRQIGVLDIIVPYKEYMLLKQVT